MVSVRLLCYQAKRAVNFTLVSYVSVKSKLQHDPPGKPRAFDTFAVPGRRVFDYQGLPGGGEFDLHALGVGNLNCTHDFM